MNKLPVGETIRFAYAFTFGEIGTIIGLIWIPALVNVVASFLVLHNFGGLSMPSQDTASGAPENFGVLMLYTLFAALVFAMIATSVVKQAMGLRQGPAFAHFSLGATELRVFGGLFGLYLLLVVFLMGLVLLLLLIATLCNALVPAGQAAAAGAVVGDVAAVVGLLGIGYATVRLSFLFVPAAVNDGTFGLTRSWQLTSGNFWRIVLVGLATAVPVLILILAAQFAILGPDYFRDTIAMMQDPAHAAKYTAAQAQLVADRTPLLLGFGFVITPLTNGLLFAPAAFAYRALSGKSE